MRINAFFADLDAAGVTRLRTCLSRQLSSIDGPADYGQEVPGTVDGINAGDEPCKDMTTVHDGLGITIDDFNALVEDLVQVLDTAGVPEGDKNAILGALGPTCASMVTPPGDCAM